MRISVFADLALYLAVGGLASVELSSSLSLSCFKHVWHRFLGCLSLLCGAFHALFLFLSSSSVIGSRSATSYLATALRLSTALLSARGRALACSGPCCESSSGSSVPISAQLLKLFDITLTRSFLGVLVPPAPFHLRHFSCRTRDANSAPFFSLNHTLLVQVSVSV